MELSEEEFDIVQMAITLSRRYQYPTIEDLKFDLKTHYPNQDQSIDRALVYWGSAV